MNKIRAINILCGILLANLLIQPSFGKPIDDDSMLLLNKKFGESIEKIHLTENNSTEYYANRTANTARLILKDPTVIANRNVEVEEFKVNLTTILNNYDEIQKNPAIVNGEIKNNTASELAYLNGVVAHFMEIIEHYFEIPEEEMTTDSKFIADVLKKYGGYEIYVELKSISEALAHIMVRVLAEALFGWLKSNRQ